MDFFQKQGINGAKEAYNLFFQVFCCTLKGASANVSCKESC